MESEMTATRHAPGAPIETHPKLAEILVALRRGEAIRAVARRFELAPASIHKLAHRLADQQASRDGAESEPPDTDAPKDRLSAVDLVGVIEASCAVCAAGDHVAAGVERALHTPAPDLTAIGKRFGFDSGALKQHWDHMPPPHPLPAPPPAPPRWRPRPPPHPLPADRAEAEGLLAKAPGAALAMTAWARRECDDAVPHCPAETFAQRLAVRRAFEMAVQGGQPVEVLLAAGEMVRQMTKLTELDAETLWRERERQRFLASLPAPVAWDAQAFIHLLAARGVTMRIDDAGALLLQNASALNSVDREILSHRRNDIAAALNSTEKF